jgi:uncharacterized protein YndB with AHSA1/START domain
MIWHHHGVTIADPEQVVIEADPYRRLSYAWHAFSPELARRFGMSDELQAEVAAEPRSRATFEIEDQGTHVKLTVVHDDLAPAGKTITMISEGWPHVLSDLKTLLETGATLEPAS